MFVAAMRELLDMQVVRVIDILTDLQDHRQRFGGPQIGGNHFGQLVADMLGYIAGMLLPLAVPLGRSLFVRPVFGLGNQKFGILLSEFIRPVASSRIPRISLRSREYSSGCTIH